MQENSELKTEIQDIYKTIKPANSVPLATPLVLKFSDLTDCLVKLPVAVQEKDSRFFMKIPVQPVPEWNLDAIIKAVEFQKNHKIELHKSTLDDQEFWNSEIIEKVAYSEFGEIYEIKQPVINFINSRRKAERFFILCPVLCFSPEETLPKVAVCLDISETGLSLKFKGNINFPTGKIFKIIYQKPFDKMPQIEACVVRTSFNLIDNSTIVGLLIQENSKTNMLEAIKYISEQSDKDSFKIQKTNPKDDKSIFKLFH